MYLFDAHCRVSSYFSCLTVKYRRVGTRLSCICGTFFLSRVSGGGKAVEALVEGRPCESTHSDNLGLVHALAPPSRTIRFETRDNGQEKEINCLLYRDRRPRFFRRQGGTVVPIIWPSALQARPFRSPEAAGLFSGEPYQKIEYRPTEFVPCPSVYVCTTHGLRARRSRRFTRNSPVTFSSPLLRQRATVVVSCWGEVAVRSCLERVRAPPLLMHFCSLERESSRS